MNKHHSALPVRIRPEPQEQARQEGRRGPPPDAERAPGFNSYSLIDAGDGVMTSVSFFDTAAQADESNRIAASWLREQKLEQALPNAPKITSGDLVVHKTHRTLVPGLTVSTPFRSTERARTQPALLPRSGGAPLRHRDVPERGRRRARRQRRLLRRRRVASARIRRRRQRPVGRRGPRARARRPAALRRRELHQRRRRRPGAVRRLVRALAGHRLSRRPR